MAQVLCPVCGGVRGGSYDSCYKCNGTGVIDDGNDGSKKSSSSSSSSLNSSTSYTPPPLTESERKTFAELKERQTSGRQSLNDLLNQMVRDFNAGNWDAVIKEEFITDNIHTHNVYSSALAGEYLDKAKMLLGAARANRDNDYEAAFNSFSYLINSKNEELFKIVIRSGKKAWEKIHGRTMTTSDFAKYECDSLLKTLIKLSSEGCIERKDLPKDFTGKAKIKYEYSVYEGDFVNGKPHGIGIEYHKSEQILEGEFVDGELTGKGRHTFINSGSFYEGDFVKGEWTGYGKTCDKYGKVEKEGYFENGIYKGKGILKKLFGKK